MDTVENTPQGLSIDQAVAQLQANRKQTQETEQLQEGEVEVVEELEQEEEAPEEESDLDGEEGEETEGESEGDSPDEVFELEIDGEIVDVPLEELHKGYLRHNDYTRKRQADAKVAKELQSEYTNKISALDQAIGQNVSQEELMLGKLQQQMGQTQDQAQKQQLHYKILQLGQSIQTRKEMNKEVQALRDQHLAAEREAKLGQEVAQLEVLFGDQWDTKREELSSYLNTQGFEDLTPFVDHRMAVMVDKAKQFDELQHQRETTVSKKIRRKVPAPLKGGQGEKKFSADKQQIAQLQETFNRTGSIKDALALSKAKKGR